MTGSTRVAVVGPGNIGTDLMIKVIRTSSVLEMGAMVGIDPASDGLARAARMGVPATRCTEGDIAAQHIARARELDMDVAGLLMLSHIAPHRELAAQAKLMESYGAHCVYVTDSGGRLTMRDTAARVDACRDVLDESTEIGRRRMVGGQEDMIVDVALDLVRERDDNGPTGPLIAEQAPSR
jgi:hypothetical protein